MRVEARGLGREHAGRSVLEDVSFTVRPGRVTGFLGLNGAGKSTTMRLMVGLERGRGRTTFDGVPYADLDDPGAAVGLLLDHPSFAPRHGARRQLRWYAAQCGVGDDRVEELLEAFDLTVAADRPVGRCSLGQVRRAELALALLADPEVLLLDEPGNGLDPQGRRDLDALLLGAASRGRAVLVSSHALDDLERTCDDVVVLHRGRLVFDGTLETFVGGWSRTGARARSAEPRRLAEALRRNGIEAVVDRVWVEADAPTDDVAAVAAQEGVLVLELTAARCGLDEAFLRAAAHQRGSAPLVAAGAA